MGVKPMFVLIRSTGRTFTLVSPVRINQVFTEGEKMSQPEDERLEGLRRDLANMDQVLVGLLNSRQALSHKIQMYKHSKGMARKDPEQETKVIQRIRQGNPGPMSCEALEEVYRTIFKHVVAEG